MAQQKETLTVKLEEKEGYLVATSKDIFGLYVAKKITGDFDAVLQEVQSQVTQVAKLLLEINEGRKLEDFELKFESVRPGRASARDRRKKAPPLQRLGL